MIKIEKLKNCPEAIANLATLWYENLGRKWTPDIKLKTIAGWYHEWLNDELPLAYVALEDDTPVASFSLQWEDGVRPDLKPWLGDLVVAKMHQDRGIGTQLIRFAIEKVKEMGFEQLYLFTFDEKLTTYYAKFGYCIFAHDHYENKPVIIMKLDL